MIFLPLDSGKATHCLDRGQFPPLTPGPPTDEPLQPGLRPAEKPGTTPNRSQPRAQPSATGGLTGRPGHILKKGVFLARAGMLNPALFQTNQSNISRLLP